MRGIPSEVKKGERYYGRFVNQKTQEKSYLFLLHRKPFLLPPVLRRTTTVLLFLEVPVPQKRHPYVHPSILPVGLCPRLLYDSHYTKRSNFHSPSAVHPFQWSFDWSRSFEFIGSRFSSRFLGNSVKCQ